MSPSLPSRCKPSPQSSAAEIQGRQRPPLPRGGCLRSAQTGRVFEPILFFLFQKEKNGFNLPRKERGHSKSEVQTVPPSRQKKPAPFRFRRGGENSISAGSFFLSESRPLRWVAFRLILEKKENIQNRKCKPCRHRVRRSQLHSVSAGAAKTPYPQPSSSFPNCDRFTGSQFGHLEFYNAARDLDDGRSPAFYGYGL